MTSLRKTALIWLTALLTLVGAVAVAISYRFAEAEADDLLDTLLHQIALNVDPSIGEVTAPALAHNPEDALVIEVWNKGGEKVQTSHPEIEIPRQTEVGFANIRAAGEDWRTYMSVDRTWTVQVSQRMTVRHEMARHAAVRAAAPILAVIPLSWLVVGWALGRILGRLTALARTVAERGTDSKEPIPLNEVPMELSPLVGAMNGLMARVQAALDQQRRFVADAAHELRTPLTALRLQIDNLKDENAGDSAKTHLFDLDLGARRAAALVDQLLRIARYDAATEGPQRERIDLAALVMTCIADHVLLAEQKGVDIGVAEQQSGIVLGSPRELQTLFANLFNNAIRYTPTEGAIDISIRRLGDGMVVEIADTGCGIPNELMPRIFDRFVRGAPSEVEGTGLGLAIVKAIADRHGIGVTLTNRQDRSGIIARVVFPATARKPSDALATRPAFDALPRAHGIHDFRNR
jgi:two-component system OmpR family sensor kinase